MGFSPISNWFSSSSVTPNDPPSSAAPFGSLPPPGLSSMSTAVSESSSEDLAQAFTLARREAKARSGESADVTKQVKGVALDREQSQQAQESDRSLEALNTLLAASFTEGFTAQTSTSLDERSSGRYTSVLPPAFTDFASRYPLITIASLGALGTTVLLGTGALTARVFRSATRARSPISLDVRLDDMERVIVTKIKQTQKKNAEGLNGALQKLAAGEMGAGRSLSAAASQKGLQSEPVLNAEEESLASDAEDARLAQIVRATLKEVLAERASSLQSGGEVSEQPYQLSHVMDSVDRLEHITLGILEEIKLLRASQAASDSPVPRPDGVLSMKELSGMVEQFQAQTRELNKENAAESVSLADVSDEASAPGTARSDEEDAVARAIYSYDLGGKEEAFGVVADELEKAVKPRRKRKAEVSPVEVDEVASSAEHALNDAQTLASTDAQGPPSEDTLSTPPPLTEPAPIASEEQAASPAADEVLRAASEGQAEPAASPAVETTPAPKKRSRKPTPLPESTPEPSATQTRHFGIDDSGAWSCQVMPAKGDFFRLRKWCEMDVVVLKRTGVREVIDVWSGERLAFQSTATQCEVVRTSVFRNPDVELVILDGAVWRCYSRSADGEYTIAERIGDA